MLIFQLLREKNFRLKKNKDKKLGLKEIKWKIMTGNYEEKLLQKNYEENYQRKLWEKIMTENYEEKL